MNAVILTIYPYQRIRAAGFDVTVSHPSAGYRISLVRNGQTYAQAECSRSGSLSAAGALERARTGTWSPASSFYKALGALAAVAESLNVTE